MIDELNLDNRILSDICILTMVLTEVALDKVVVHPLVLLSVVDHFSRMGKIGNQKRVLGLLLGSWSSKGILDIANSFAIPFDEDDKVCSTFLYPS
jgi:26S proteasome regulatory subunit N8